METKIFGTDEKSINQAGAVISNGGLVAFPTETVYGLGGNALDGSSVKKIYAAKGRPSDNPLIIHIADKADIEKYTCDINENAKKLIDAFMPGPFTVILKRKPIIPNEVTAGKATVAVRFPENDTAQRLIKAAGVPIAAPSANISGKPSPTAAKHVVHDLMGKIDGIIDGGSCDVGVESTIVDATGTVPVLLRPGGITYDMLIGIVPELEISEHILKSVGENEEPLCPGMKYEHYSPDAEVIVVEGEMKAVKKKITELIEENKGKVCGVLTTSDNAYDFAVILQGGMTNREYCRNLFANLREFDNLKVDIVFAEFEERDDYALTAKNRLYKAAGQRVIKV